MNRILASLAICSIVALAAGADEDDKVKLSKEEELVLDMTNKARAKENLQPLKIEAILTKAARNHSANMAKQQKEAHVLDNKTPTQRVNDLGYLHAVCAENVGWVDDPKVIPKMFTEGWMKSPGHRKNIVYDKFEEIGIGIAAGKGPAGTGDANKDGFYLTQVFATPRKKK